MTLNHVQRVFFEIGQKTPFAIKRSNNIFYTYYDPPYNIYKIEGFMTKGLMISRKRKFQLSALSCKTRTLVNINN